MKTFKTIAAIALVGAAIGAQAQGFRMFGGGGGMSQGMVLFNMRMNFGGGGGPSLRDDVSKELKLTDGQKTKLTDYQQKQMEEMMSRFQGGGGPPDQDEIQKMMKKRQEDEDKALKEILDDGQRKRLRELWIQRLGNGAINNAELQKELNVTDDQKAKIKKLQDQQQEANQALFEKMRNGEIDRSEIMPIMQKARAKMDEELGKVMTDEQKAKLKTLGGTPFKFDEDTGG